jgi:hypothetical protein
MGRLTTPMIVSTTMTLVNGRIMAQVRVGRSWRLAKASTNVSKYSDSGIAQRSGTAAMSVEL